MATIDSWHPAPHEASYFETLFHTADPLGTGELQGKAAVEFFQKSGLERTVLKQIWAEANLRNGASLSKHEFNIAMRLIALAQNNQAPTRVNLLATAHLPMPPPRFAGVPGPAPVSAVGIPPVSAIGVAPGSWSISPADHAKYDALFAQEDADHDGFITGQQAVLYLSKSGLDKALLKHIWTLSDFDKDGNLDREEFAIATHLVVGASKRGLQVPPVLPPELIPVSKRAGVHPPVSIHGIEPPKATTPVSVLSGVEAVHTRPSSGSMSLSEALDLHIDGVTAPTPSSSIPSATVPTPGAGSFVHPPASVGGLPPVPPTRKASNPAIQTFHTDTSPAAQVTPTSAPVHGHGGFSAPPEMISAAKELESAMQSHLKRENTLANDRRALVETAANEMKFLENEKQVLLRQLESVRQQIAEEDNEYRRISSASQAIRAEIAQLRQAKHHEEETLGAKRLQTSSSGIALGALVREFTELGGSLATLQADVKSLVEARFEALLASQSLSANTNAVQNVATLHTASATASSTEANELNAAAAQLRTVVASLKAEFDRVKGELPATANGLQSAISQYEDAVKQLQAARNAHVASISKQAEAKADVVFLQKQDAALANAIAALQKLQAAEARQGASLPPVTTQPIVVKSEADVLRQTPTNSNIKAATPVAPATSAPAPATSAPAPATSAFSQDWAAPQAQPVAPAPAVASSFGEWDIPAAPPAPSAPKQTDDFGSFGGFDSQGFDVGVAGGASFNASNDGFSGFDSFGPPSQTTTTTGTTTNTAAQQQQQPALDDFSAFGDAFGSQPVAQKPVDDWSF